MTRRRFAATWAAVPALALAAETPLTLRGRLTQTDGQPPALTLEGGKRILLEGDEQTTGVLKDARLKDVDFEVVGVQQGDRFLIAPIHKRAMFVHKEGRRLFVTYWCAVCSIRTYTPGICWCCQDETALDLKEKLDNSL